MKIYKINLLGCQGSLKKICSYTRQQRPIKLVCQGHQLAYH